MNLNEFIEKYEKQKNKSGGENFDDRYLQIPVYKADEDIFSVRILPGENDGDFITQTAVHGIDGGKYTCPREEGHKCPVCEVYFKCWELINAAGGRDNPITKPWQEFAKQLRAYKRYYMNVVDRRDNSVRIWSTGQTIFDKIAECAINPDYGDRATSPASLEEGWDMRIKMVKKGEYNNYDQCAFRPKATPAGSDKEILKWMDEKHDLSDLIIKNEDGALEQVALTKKAEFEVLINESHNASSPSSNGGNDEEEFAESLEEEIES